MKKKEILEYLQENPGWVLQYCDGIRDGGWWWLRKTSEGAETINLDGRAARAASNDLVRLSRVKYGSTDFVLPNAEITGRQRDDHERHRHPNP